jgi:predicted nuclease of restriction endonuclease-like (RecB) superfamily
MVILDSCSDPETSEFYARLAAQDGWTRGALQSMIASRLHERVQPALTNFDRSLPEADRDAVREIVKDPYVLDFLASDPVRERDLSKALTDNLARFLRELGTGFAFVGAEVPLRCGDREFFLDLLFYHCRLHRYVVFELKLGRFEPEYAGKLNFYVQLVDDHLRDQTTTTPPWACSWSSAATTLRWKSRCAASARPSPSPSGAACPPRSARPSRPPRTSPRL